MAINLKGTFLTVKYAVPPLKERGGAVVIVLFLCSDASSHITGTELWIDGGESLLQG